MKSALRPAVAAIVAALTLPLVTVASVSASPPIATGPDGGAAGAAWTAAHDGPPQYPNINIQWDVPITMSDGVVLKANVYRPADAAMLPVDVQTPVIVNITPYTKLVSNLVDHALSIPVLSHAVLELLRQIDFSGTALSGITDLTKGIGGGWLRNFAVDRHLVQAGYTQVVVDTRGTGFSEGVWDALREREQQDSVEVIEWASRQPWSDGNIGMSGMSYSAINQLQTAELRPPALKALFPVLPGSDLAQDVLAPGNGFGVTFITLWLSLINGLKWVPDVQSILTGTFDSRWLWDRIHSPLTFMDVELDALTSTRWEDLSPLTKDVLTEGSPTRRTWLGDPSRVQVPTFVVGGWHDLFTYSESKIYNQIPLLPGRKQLLIGDTYHITPGNEYGNDGLPPRLDVLQRAWFDKWLKGIDNGIDTYGPVTVFQLGAGWVTLDGFGPSAVADAPRYRRMYLSANRSGTATSVYDGTLAVEPDNDITRLSVAPGLTTLCSNDAAQATVGLMAIIVACGDDSRIAELNGLTFTSAPVAEPTTISGPIAVRLNTVHDASDGYWTVTINDVAPDGRSSVLSSGQLLASARLIDESLSARSPNGDYTDPRPYASLSLRQPTVPGEATTLDIGLAATEAVLAPGHRLRVDIFAGNLPKGVPIMPDLVNTGLKPEHVLLDPDAPSFVNIPVRGNPGW
ncbi:CocE/NonD family hydrolase [Nocardia sp. CDC159]|uniref:CocE/NonD family hydrolase n=1 Tax=Nocardia pulmonis TaxID=2951408 RepID=A0A9X2IX51_9NOCA|nr:MULTISPECIES: CocE/NonD family hydrolase [Nocardia]MCM6775642.1 CocE/NonD family hydrolase [Nocardia pulmonis]MCM6788382.1 CocE/NonD family hydrolase [Nocardia sp. CDC159]